MGSLVAWSRVRPDSTYLNSSIIRAPSNKGNLASLALPAREIIIKIINRISWTLGHSSRLGLGLGIDELLAEGVPVGFGASIFDDDGLVVVGEGVDDVFDGFAELELVELGDALGCDLDSMEPVRRSL